MPIEDDSSLVIRVVSQEFSEAEAILLSRLLSDPIMKKYLQILMYNQIADHANISLATIAGDGAFITAIKQAFVKGGLSILQTLHDFQAPQPTSVQATQQGQNTQR